jgi:hypothetical protein
VAASSRARGPIALALWLAVTVSAVAVVWVGMASVVNSQIGASPELFTPIDRTGTIGAVGDPPGLGASDPAVTPSASPSAPPVQTTTPPAAPPPVSPPGHATPSTAYVLHRYSMVGGVVVAEISGDDAVLVSATPNPGFQMQDWVEDKWLRVDFTDESDISNEYSLFISWNGYSPLVSESGPNS